VVILGHGLAYFFIVGAVVCLITITWAGVQWATAKKDKAKRARARGRIIWSLVGLVGVFVAYFILSVIVSLFSLDPL
jgi:hypothetical protein